MPERLLWGALKTDCSVRLGCAKRVLYGSADPAIRSPLALRYRCVGAPVATVASKAVGNFGGLASMERHPAVTRRLVTMPSWFKSTTPHHMRPWPNGKALGFQPRISGSDSRRTLHSD